MVWHSCVCVKTRETSARLWVCTQNSGRAGGHTWQSRKNANAHVDGICGEVLVCVENFDGGVENIGERVDQWIKIRQTGAHVWGCALKSSRVGAHTLGNRNDRRCENGTKNQVKSDLCVDGV